MPKSEPAHCRTCGVRPRPWVRVRLPEGGDGYYCVDCGPAVKAAAKEREQERWSRLKKKKAEAPARCTGGQPHHFVLTQAYDAQHRCGDRGVCSRCGLERFWMRPGEGQHKWRVQSLKAKAA